jgi:predicted RND superfamily exporter protein
MIAPLKNNQSFPPGRLDKSSGNKSSDIFQQPLYYCDHLRYFDHNFGMAATKLKLNASFEKMIPRNHQYITNYFANKKELAGMGNSIRITVALNKEGTIYRADYLAALQKINDEVFFFPGVDRVFMKSLWTPATRWSAVTEEGLTGGPVIPDTYNGSKETIEELRNNVERSGEIGTLVAPNYKSSVIFIPLLDTDPDTGEPLDYYLLSQKLEGLRNKHNSDLITLHITGFAKIAGDLMEGLLQVIQFFIAAIVIASIMVFWFTRCVRSTFKLS